MEYVFGTEHRNETLRTKGEEHTDLTGFQEVVREYPDQTITDRFLIVRKTHSDEDVEGNCYDWYIIDKHYRYTDKTGPIKDEVDKTNNAIGGGRTDRMYEPGEYIALDGVLYKVTLSIPAGGYIAVGSNVEATDIATELSKLQ